MHGYEWDDFTSWDHDIPEVEALRKRIEAWDRLLFTPERRTEYFELIEALAREIREAAT
ncbi:hypothetical protein [Caulobacter mirabilis]|uniref:hypothetical protein n=1 Tax=Caulobacter mirabilis TaxID=69666 RepID=UPI0015592E76|nr:hypothetical protein [Caulobacter mirabilis]